MRIDVVVLCALWGLLIALAAARRDFLGDGVRHLPAVLSGHPQFGEPRWLLFPLFAWVWVRPFFTIGIVTGPESALQALLWLCVASGIVFLYGIRSWLLVECRDDGRRAAALLLAGSYASVPILFTDIAEPQIAAAIVVAGLAYARAWRDDPHRATHGAMAALVAIAVASLIYQGAILALGLLPLVVSSLVIDKRRVMAAAAASVLAVFAAMIAAQIATGTPAGRAVATAFGGERNPLTRSLMSAQSPAKYLVALVAGPPQGVAALENFHGLPALVSAFRSGDGPAARLAALNAFRLLLGCAVLAILLVNGVCTANSRVLVALAVLLVLPVLRNQQYGYPKFFILWPVPVALLAIRCRPRTIVVAAIAVLMANGWLVVRDIRRGRQLYATVQEVYGHATPSTCWMTSGWSPPVSYLWPGTTAPILGILATGNDPSVQASGLTTTLRRCFCEADAVWTDTSARDTDNMVALAHHFAYTAIDMTSILAQPSELVDLPMPSAHAYSEQGRQRICRLTGAPPRR